MSPADWRRFRQRWWLRLYGPPIARDLWLIVVTILVLQSVHANGNTIDRIEREGIERRDQTCTLFETDHLQDAQRLARTYQYLDNLTPAQRREPLNQALVAQLPETEAEARSDSAPPYCDEPGAEAEKNGAEPVGLPEPDPILPERPASLP